MNFEPVAPPYLMALSYGKRLEMVAAMLVGQVTETELRELDPGGGREQLPDFEIVEPTSASRIGVMEVTTSGPVPRSSSKTRLATSRPDVVVAHSHEYQRRAPETSARIGSCTSVHGEVRSTGGLAACTSWPS
jgi:hypothetical protein